jgi:ribosomal protein S18 acetylase RimI-like enzyme
VPDEFSDLIWRPAADSDLSMIADAQQETFRLTKGRAASAEELAEMTHRTASAIGSPAAHHLEILEQHGERLGYFWVSLEAIPEPMLLDIYVAASSRDRGLGRAIMHRILSVLRDRNVTRFSLAVSRSNHAARALYQQFGANLVESSGNNLLVMSLPVPTPA